jgi:hypothetical protein
MAPRANQHLEAEDLLALDRGGLAELVAAAMRRHLTDCADCRRLHAVVRVRRAALSSVVLGTSETSRWEGLAHRAVDTARLAAPTPVLFDRLSRWLETHPGRSETALRVCFGASTGRTWVDATGLERVALAGAKWRLASRAPRDTAYTTRDVVDATILTADLEGERATTRVVVGPGRAMEIRLTKLRRRVPAPLAVVAPIAGGESRVEFFVRTIDGFVAHFADLSEGELLVVVEPFGPIPDVD